MNSNPTLHVMIKEKMESYSQTAIILPGLWMTEAMFPSFSETFLLRTSECIPIRYVGIWDVIYHSCYQPKTKLNSQNILSSVRHNPSWGPIKQGSLPLGVSICWHVGDTVLSPLLNYSQKLTETPIPSSWPLVSWYVCSTPNMNIANIYHLTY